ncbi:MAG: TonB family protein [Phycisphaerae bacterium]
MSILLHGAVFTGAYVTDVTPRRRTDPVVYLAKGERAVRTTILLTPSRMSRDVVVEPEPGAVETAPRGEPVYDDARDADVVDAVSHVADAPRAVPAAVVDVGPVDAVNADDAVGPPAPPDDMHIAVTDPELIAAPAPPAERKPRPAARRADATPITQPELTPRPPPEKLPLPPSAPPRAVVPRAVSSDAARSTPGVKTGVEVVRLPRPRYPLLSRRLGEAGLVVLEVEVLADGRAGAIHIVRDAGYPRLARSAKRAVRKAKFKPATRDGRPVRDVVRIPFRFVLR